MSDFLSNFNGDNYDRRKQEKEPREPKKEAPKKGSRMSLQKNKRRLLNQSLDVEIKQMKLLSRLILPIKNRKGRNAAGSFWEQSPLF